MSYVGNTITWEVARLSIKLPKFLHFTACLHILNSMLAMINWSFLAVDPKSDLYTAVLIVHLGPHISWDCILVFIRGRRALL